MKIQGPNQTNFNPYKNLLQKQKAAKSIVNKEDQLQISSQAKKLLENQQPNEQRAERIEKLKAAVESGAYKADAGKIAEKMLEFWKKQ